MEEDFSILLAEYNRLTNATVGTVSFTESPAIIPILLRHGTFTPSRLERWPFSTVLLEMENEPLYRDRFICAFNDLLEKELPLHSASPVANLNYKKGVALLLATKDSFPQLHGHLHPSIVKLPRFLLLAIEYTAVPLEMCLNLPYPFPHADTLAPKLKAKYPLLVSIITDPHISLAREALHRLQTPATSADLEAKLALACAARALDSHSIYKEIIGPVWEAKDEELAVVVFEAISHSDELKAFCQEYLKDLKQK